MNKDELKARIEDQEKEFTRSNAEITADYFAGEKVEYQPYGINGPDFAIANYFGYKTTDLGPNEEANKAVAEEKEKLGLSGNGIFLEGKQVAALVGSDLIVPENGIPRNANQVLKDYDDLDDIMEFDFANSDLYKGILENARQMKENEPDEPIGINVNGPITFAATIRPIEMLLRDMRKDPDNYDKLLNFCTDKIIEWVDLLHDVVGDNELTFMDPVSTSTILSRDQFHEFSLPYMRRFVDESREILNSPISVHICGDTKEIWEELGTIDFKLFSVDNAEDMGELKETLGNQLIISGNIPPVDVLRYGTIDDVIESVKETIIKAADSPKGFILDAGCMITPGTPRENLWAMIYAVREYGRGAQLGHLPDGVKEFI